jgi:beta-galactosidase
MQYYGVSYYPEHKSEDEISKDVALMAGAGINTVRMGEFAWCRFEPVEGRYEFEWLDKVIEELGDAGLYSIICTPTACPPAWLAEKHPSILYRDNRGMVRPFGGRRHYCCNNDVYREYCVKIAEEIGRRYRDNKNVIAFQIDNELAQEGTGRCHCEVCRVKFRRWLETKYADIKSLNECMGTIFWGQEYDSFEQIPLPVGTIEADAQEAIKAYYENPSLRLDYERFCSDSYIDFQNLQKTALKKQVKQTVTTNATGLATNSLDYYRAFSELDVYAYDFYPSLREGKISSFSYSFSRGIKDKNFWILEFVSGGGHRLNGSGRLQPYPGALKQSVIHAFASGAQLLCHFQFKTFPFGAEQLNYAILDLDGIPGRRYLEMKAAMAELKNLGGILDDSSIVNRAALCFDYDTLWSTRIKPINRETFDYLSYCEEFYEAFVRLGIGVDVVSCSKDLEKYKLVIVPVPFVMNEKFKSGLKEYVKQGGIVVSTFLAGAKNSCNVGLSGSLPCGLTDLFGLRVSEVEPVFDPTTAVIHLRLGDVEYSGCNKYWTEVLEAETAELIGIYGNTFRKGAGVIGRNSYGSGSAYYIGTGLGEDLLIPLLQHIAQEAGIIQAPFAFPSSVEIVERQYQGRSLYFIFNFLQEEAVVELAGTFTDMRNEAALSGNIVINSKDFVVLVQCNGEPIFISSAEVSC